MGAKPYDPASPESITKFARALTGNCLADVIDISAITENVQNKGDLGNLVEKYYFEISPGNSHEPDFPEAGLELKTTGVVRKQGIYRVKERLVLQMIDYEVIVDEEWETSRFLNKCSQMLLMFYEYEPDVSILNRRFVVEPILYRIPAKDLDVIRNDWETIRNKVIAGKAHELSEGDTLYLGACRKGAGGVKEALRKQPKSSTPAKGRAFSFKPSYVNKLINSPAANEIDILSSQSKSLDAVIHRKFHKHLGKTTDQLLVSFGFNACSKDKAILHRLAVRILADGKQSVRELDKAGIEMKTIRLERNGKPKESMSFPSFEFMKMAMQDWEESEIFEKVETRFLFVIFQRGADNQLRLTKVKFWNMPYEDRQQVKKVWQKTKKAITSGGSLPRASENPVSHVRPKGRNGSDFLPTPDGRLITKQSFWLNRDYVAKVVAE